MNSRTAPAFECRRSTQQRGSPTARVASKIAILAALFLVACRDDPPSPNAPPRAPRPQRQVDNDDDGNITGPRAYHGNAKTQVAKALRGRNIRALQDDMLRVEAVAPGFGGFFINSDEQVVLWQKPVPGAKGPLLRGMIHGRYQNDPSRITRLLLESSKDAEIREAKFSLSELVAFEQAIFENHRAIAGFAGVGVSVSRNVVEVGVAGESSVGGARTSLQSLGIPDSAVLISAMGRATSSSSKKAAAFTQLWTYMQEPYTYGGIMIETWGGQYDYRIPGGDSVFVTDGGSHGFNVRLDNQSGQPTRMLLASHIINGYYATNGDTGKNIYQPTKCTNPFWACSSPIARVTTNTPWSTSGCVLGATYCTDADVALATFASGITGVRKVGTSVSQGDNGASGSAEIQNWHPISDVIDISLVPDGTKNVFKSGMNTGTTSGTINTSYWNVVDSTVKWGNPFGTTTVKVAYTNQLRVDSIGFGFGDSGAPIFVRTKFSVNGNIVCGDYCALGMESWGGPDSLTSHTGTQRCFGGKKCYIGGATWARIETVLGLGTLNPRTTP